MKERNGGRDEVWTQTEVARYLRCSPGTVSKWVHQKMIDTFQLPSGGYRILNETVEAIKRNEYAPPPKREVDVRAVTQFEARKAAALAKIRLLTAKKPRGKKGKNEGDTKK